MSKTINWYNIRH